MQSRQVRVPAGREVIQGGPVIAFAGADDVQGRAETAVAVQQRSGDLVGDTWAVRCWNDTSHLSKTFSTAAQPLI